MVILRPLLLLSTLASLGVSLPSQEPFLKPPKAPTSLPVVLWHGLGDTYDSKGMTNIAAYINKTYPGTFVHSIYLSENAGEDRNAGFIGHLSDQIELVCQQLASIPELHSGFDAMGFSQGGQFLRGFVERCNHPPVRNLITWGSQHNGIADLPDCADGDWFCKATFGLLRRNLWTSYVRNNLIQAQYWRDPDDYERYLELSAWLADINNERNEKNQTYAKHLSYLEKFVMIKFKEEKTVVPPDSSWFGEYNVTSKKHTPLRETESYKEDWIGLKTLDEKKGLVFLETEGGHMQISEDFLMHVIGKYLGPYNHLREGE